MGQEYYVIKKGLYLSRHNDRGELITIPLMKGDTIEYCGAWRRERNDCYDTKHYLMETDNGINQGFLIPNTNGVIKKGHLRKYKRTG